MNKNPLPGWAFMIVGLLLMGYTKFIQGKQPAAKISIFFYLGILFILFGVFREFTSRKKPKAVKEQVGPPPRQQHPVQGHHLGQTHQHMASQTNATHQHVRPQQHASHPYQPQHKQCPRCHQANAAQARYCHNCAFQYY